LLRREEKGEEEEDEDEEEEEVECARKKSVNPLEIVHKPNLFFSFFSQSMRILTNPTRHLPYWVCLCILAAHHYFWPGLIPLPKNTLHI
jgi:hypothetical protein